MYSLAALARSLVIMGGSFDPPTSAHISLMKKLLETPDTDVVIMVNTGGKKLYHLSALERIRLVAAGLGADSSRVRIVLQGYSSIGTVPILLGALSSATYDRVSYAIGADVHADWKGILPQVGERLVPPRSLRYIVMPRPNTKTGKLEEITLLNPELEEVLQGVEATTTSSTGVRDLLAGLSFDQEPDLAALADVSQGVAEILIRDRLLRSRAPDEVNYFNEFFVARFLEIRGKLSREFPGHSEAIAKASVPAFDPTASVLAWDEAIVRKIVDAVVAEKKLAAYTIKDFPTNGRFGDSLLYYEMMGAVHPEYKVFSPHISLGKTTDLRALTELVYPGRFSSSPATTEIHQLPSGSFTAPRRALHEQLLEEFEKSLRPQLSSGEPRVVFLAGAPGAGKTKVLQRMQEGGSLDLPVLDMDRFRTALVELDSSLRELPDPVALSLRTNGEASYLQGLAWAKMMRKKKSFIVDGTFSATEYFEGVMARMKAAGYKISIIYVTAPEAHLEDRIEKRARLEGRGVPPWKIKAALKGAEASWQKLAPFADTAVRIDNPDSEDGVRSARVKEALGLKPDESMPTFEGCGRWLLK